MADNNTILEKLEGLVARFEEVYLSPEHAEEVIAISKSFNIDAQIVGRIEESDKKELIIKSEFGEFRY